MTTIAYPIVAEPSKLTDEELERELTIAALSAFRAIRFEALLAERRRRQAT